MDTSIQENLRRKALNKKPSHRNWREWDAMYNALEENEKQLCLEINYLLTSRWGFFMFGISVGTLIAYFLI